MADHMNSPKIRKALEACRAAKADFDVKQAELVAEIESHVQYASYEEVHRHEHLVFKMKEAHSAKNSADYDARHLLWAYYKGKLSNREIMNIVATALP